MINQKSFADQIEEVLKSEIVAGRYRSGTQLSISELAKRWGTSTTPVRDAIHRLSKMGFLELAPRKGVYVSELDSVRFKEIFDIRIVLEVLAIESAAVNAPVGEIERAIKRYQSALSLIEEKNDYSQALKYDDLVHNLIIKYSNNETLIDLMGSLRVLVSWVRRSVIEHLHDACGKAIPEHIVILEAMRARDRTRAKRLLKKHLGRSKRDTMLAYDEK